MGFRRRLNEAPGVWPGNSVRAEMHKHHTKIRLAAGKVDPQFI